MFNILCFALIVSSFFSNLIHLRHFGSKLQFTEIFFLLTIPFIPFRALIAYQRRDNPTFIKLILVYLLFDLLSSVLSYQRSAVFESLGRFYLLALFGILSYYLGGFDLSTLKKKLYTVLLFSSICVILIAAYGYIMIVFGKQTPYVTAYENYPYFGAIYRLNGACMYPSMMISVLIFLILYFTGILKNSKNNKTAIILMLVVLGVCAFLTLSKTILLLVFAAVVYSLKAWKILNKKALLLIAALFAGVLFISTHVIILNKSSEQVESLKSTPYTSNKILFENKQYEVLETNYLALKRLSLKMFLEHPFFGLGTGNFNARLHTYKTMGLYPQKLPDFNPHSTYLRALVENGIFAAVMLMVVLGYVFKLFISRHDLLTDTFLLSLFLLFVCFLIDGLVTDILNFRHLWLFFAMAIVYLQKTKTRTVEN